VLDLCDSGLLYWERNVTVSCPACGAPAQCEDVYCGECGTRLASEHGSRSPVEAAVNGTAPPSAAEAGRSHESPTDGMPEPPHKTAGGAALDQDVPADDEEAVSRRATSRVDTGDALNAEVRPASFPLLELGPVQCMFSPLSGSAGEDVERLEILAGRATS